MNRPVNRPKRLAKEDDVPPGDDIVPVPPPVDEDPPHDRFCDLVLTGGVASGVVYPWAIVELARAFRFRNIGGTSVGAMAAALAAAAEYGRRTSFENPFEALRRSPASLAALQADGRTTRMLSLFQTNRHGQRLMRLWGRLGRGNEAPDPGLMRILYELVRVFKWPVLSGALVGSALASILWWAAQPTHVIAIAFVGLVGLTGIVLFAATALAGALWCDFRRGVVHNEYGLCKGGSTGYPGAGSTGIVEWLHKGIQQSAGLDINDDRPLTFSDLWRAPLHPGGPGQHCEDAAPEENRSINLQMITTNVTHGRPYRLPLSDTTSRLFYRRDELEDYFPACVLDALDASSSPYAPRGSGGSEPPADHPSARGLRELPCADLPIVVAARLSLSFPLLFSAVPLWAIDYEVPRSGENLGGNVPYNEQRLLRRCMFSDGGVSSNFPVHLFDSALPRRPTFGLWLDRRSPYQHWENKAQAKEQEVWLPKYPGEGRGDNWNRFDPCSKAPQDHKLLRDAARETQPSRGGRADAGRMLGFLVGIAQSATDWRDRTSFRLPHVRNRVARMLLLPGEGGLHIGMPRRQILEMAHRYGTVAGKAFVAHFTSAPGQAPPPAWKEQRWVRFNLLVNGLRERLDGLASSAAWAAHTVPLKQAIEDATRPGGALRDRDNGQQIDPEMEAALKTTLAELQRLEEMLRAAPPAYRGQPEPELRLRPPL